MLWDVLNCLGYVEESRNEVAVITGVRTAQSKILYHIIDACNMSSNNQIIMNFKIQSKKIVIAGSSLSSNDLKTRLDLVLDRAVQFFTSSGKYLIFKIRNDRFNKIFVLISEKSYQPNDIELKLVNTLIELIITRGTRGSGIITWALAPPRPTALKICTIKSLVKLKDLNKLNCDIKIVI